MQNFPPVDIIFNCWEKTYPKLLDGIFIPKICQQNHFKFKNVIVLLNDVVDRPHVEEIAEGLKSKNIITDYFFVEDYQERVYQELGLTREALGYNKSKAFYYITNWSFIVPFVAKSKYFVHWDENTQLVREGDWITPCVEELERNPKCFVGNPMWIDDAAAVREISYSETDEFFRAFLFSEVVYLANRRKFMKRIYNYRHFYTFRYHMSYIGSIFEMRVDSFMRFANLHRIILKSAVYDHPGLQGIFYPARSLRDRFKSFLYEVVYITFHLIYNPINNTYSFSLARFGKQFLKYIKKFLSYHVKTR